MTWVIWALLGIGLATVLLWWLLIETEGVYLGRWAVIWLYDVYANKYDQLKSFEGAFEHHFLAVPLMDAVEPHHAPMVLDVATGTGRLPLALLCHMDFQGRVVGVDLSRRMLHIAGEKFQDFRDRVPLVWCPAEHLPFPDATFDIVTFLEAIEFVDDPALVLDECLRVLRPGGVLLTTVRRTGHLMPGKAWSEKRFAAYFESRGVHDTKIEMWQTDYKKFWAWKPGDAPPTGSRPLGEVLRCPCCTGSLMTQQGGSWVCQSCDGTAPIAADGVIELAPLVSRCQTAAP